MKASSPRRKIIAWIFLGLFVAFDVGCVSALVRQWQSGKYTATSGRILRSEGVVEHYRDSDGNDQTKESWALSFEYQANGRRHVGNTYRRFNSVPAFVISPLELASRFPAGTTRPVYFDPANPAFAVLEAGWQTSDYVFAAGLVLLNAFVAMLAIPGAGWAVLDRLLALVGSKRRRASTAPGGARIHAQDGQLHVWVMPSSALGAAIVTFILTVLLLFWFNLPRSWFGLGFNLAVASGLAFWAAKYQGRTDRQRGPDLVFDPTRGVLTRRRPPPPLATGREGFHGRMVAWGRGPHEPVVLPFQTIRAIEVAEEKFTETNLDEGAETESIQSYFHVEARIVDAAGNTSECRLATMLHDENANELAAWLRTTLGLA